MKTSMSAILRMVRGLRLREAGSLVWRSGPKWTLANGVLLLLQGLLPLVALYLTKRVVDTVTLGVSGGEGRGVWGQAALAIGALAGVSLLLLLCRSLASLVSEAQGQAVADHVQTIVHSKSVALDLEYYENASYYDTLHRAQQESAYRPVRIVNGLATLGQSGVLLVGIVGLLLSFHWIVAVGLFAAAIPGIAVRVRYSGRLYRWQRDQTRLEREGHYLHWLLTGRYHAKEIRIFGLGPLFIDRFRFLQRRLRKERLSIAAGRTAAELGAQAVAVLAVFGCFLLIVHRTLQGAVTLGGMVMYYQAFQRAIGALQDFLGGLANLYEDSLFLTQFREFINFEPKVKEPAHPLPVPCPFHREIRLDHVRFGYPDSGREVLADIDMTVKPGQHVALVGLNGAGKTTLIKLLCRLYDPWSGSILVDGKDLRRFETSLWRRQIGIIFQDFARYEMTARDNVWFGNVLRPREDRAVVDAARRSGADAVISRLPKGYETILGKIFEGGEELSEGEWQKVALARAFMREAQILVLDEPTSSLDVEAAHEAYKQFRGLAEGKTVFLISHRLSTVRMADNIFVLEGGRIAESGSHEELMRRQGTYARLFDLQARNYLP